MRRFPTPVFLFVLTAQTALLASCGNGTGGYTGVQATGTGGGGGTTGGSGGASTAFKPGAFQAESTFAAQCASPRTGTDPLTGRAYPDVQGSLLAENNWLRAWTHDLYLWYGEVQDQDPGTFSSTAAYFGALKTTATTASGSLKDKFHFTYTTAAWEALSQSGVQAGYGATWAITAASPPRKVVVAYTEPGSPASTAPAGLVRGTQLITIDNADVATGSAATLNAGLSPATVGETHTFTVMDPGSTTTRSITMVSASVASVPVQHAGVLAGQPGVGYMLFNDHLATSEAALISAFTTLKNSNVTDLVLDIRYNGGGYLDIASEVAYMIAGPTPTAGKTFELEQFNSQHPSVDPVTGAPIAPTPFHTTSLGFSATAGAALPHLDLPRVFLLTGAGTCSASEAIINGLLGVGIGVIQVGSTTCGKPYGFYPTDNCGTTYFSIQFQGVNAMGNGGYSDGFSPQNTASGTIGQKLPGCSVADDFAHALGDPAEGRLAAALAYRTAPGACPTPATGIALRAGTPTSGEDVQVIKSPWHENRIFRH